MWVPVRPRQLQSGVATTASLELSAGREPRLPNLAFGSELRVTLMLSEQNHLLPVIPTREKFVKERRESDDVS